MKEISAFAGSLGRYKDVSVIESAIREVSPGALIAPAISRELEKTGERRKEQFEEEYRHFRKRGMERVVGILSSPEPLGHMPPQEVKKRDRKLMAHMIEELADKVKDTGLLHQDPGKFHEGRKALRKLSYCLNASAELFRFDRQDREMISIQLELFGAAQDTRTACLWLRRKGFDREADLLEERYMREQQYAIASAHTPLESGVLERCSGASRG